jgi:hypothetical protein
LAWEVLMIGTALHNRYRLDAGLCQGGAGVVYRFESFTLWGTKRE